MNKISKKEATPRRGIFTPNEPNHEQQTNSALKQAKSLRKR